MKKNDYNLIVLCGKAGTGKNYIFSKLIEKCGDDINPIISDTTRPAREGEQNGVDYRFLTPVQFAKEKHIETTSYQVKENETWLYGTHYSALDKKKVNVGIFNVKGIKQLYEQAENINIKIFYITANAKTRLYRQMERVDYPDYYEICRRFVTDEEDFKELYKYPTYKINNSENFEGDQGVEVIIDYINQLKVDSDKIV